MLTTTAFAAQPTPVCGLDFPFTFRSVRTAKVPAVKSLHLLCQLHRPQSLARGYPTNGFPDFDRLSHASFLTCSPVQNQLPSVTILNRTRLSLTLVSFDQVDLTAVAYEHLPSPLSLVLMLILRIEPDELPDCSTPQADATNLEVILSRRPKCGIMARMTRLSRFNTLTFLAL